MQKIKFFLLFVLLQALLFADIKPDQSATEGVTTSVISEDTWGVLTLARRRANLSFPAPARIFNEFGYITAVATFLVTV